MTSCRKSLRSVGVASISFMLATAVGLACDSELPHCEISHTKVVSTAQKDIGPKVVYRMDDFTILVDPEYLLAALGRAPSSRSSIAARLREETSVSTITDASYVLAMTKHALEAAHEPASGDDRELDQALEIAEQELLFALAQAIEGEKAFVTSARSMTEIRKLRLTTYRCECGSGKVFTTLNGDVLLKVVERTD